MKRGRCRRWQTSIRFSGRRWSGRSRPERPLWCPFKVRARSPLPRGPFIGPRRLPGPASGRTQPPPPWARCCSAEMRSCQCPCSGPPLRCRACAPLIPAGWGWCPRAGEGNPTRRSAAPVRRGEGKAKAPSRPGKRPPHQLLCRLVTEWPQLVPSEKPRSTVTKTLGSRGRTGFKPGLSRFLPGGPRGRRATSPGPRFLVWEVWAEGLLCIRITKHY